LYFGGCSHNYTRNVLHSTLGVAPSSSTTQNWVKILGLNAKKNNKSVLTRKTAKKFAADEQYFTLRIPGLNGTACATVCIDLETNRVVDFNVTDAKQLNYLLARETVKPIDKNAELVVTDGAPAYATAIKEMLPKAHHQICLQHRVRNKRKKKEVKKQFKKFKKGIEKEKRAKFEEKKAKMVKQHKKKLNGSSSRRREEDILNTSNKGSKKNKKGLRKS
ncbi:MAG: transposase, partial [Candidatus Helarchaeota archaeon]